MRNTNTKRIKYLLCLTSHNLYLKYTSGKLLFTFVIMFRLCKYYFWLIYCTIWRINKRQIQGKKKFKRKPNLKKKKVIQLAIFQSFVTGSHNPWEKKKRASVWTSLDHMITIKHTDKNPASVCLCTCVGRFYGVRNNQAKEQLQHNTFEYHQPISI